MVHRGPDDRGIGLYQQAGFAMQRLSIIDVTSGNQPISNEDGSIHIVFNGEIYNFVELRDVLKQRGHTFQTKTDTEVIVHAYEEWGAECVNKLNGMFAFAIWDELKQHLLLARDRTGQKPLFYLEVDDKLFFASELKSLLHTDVRLDINPTAIYHYLTLQYIPDPITIYKQVYKLPPAHILIWQHSSYQLQRYWTPDYRNKLELNEAEWVERLRYELREAVRRRLISDVPLGAFLSGGVDSSIIVGLMAELQSEPVKTFSIGFNESQFDETAHARRVAVYHNLDHHEYIVGFDDVAELLPKLVWHLDEPMADSSILPTYHLARVTREHVTVALNGDGGDEAFAGYLRYLLDKPLSIYRLVPDFIRNGIVDQIGARLSSNPNVPVEKNMVTGLKRLGQASSTAKSASILAWGSYFSEAMKQSMCQPAFLEDIAAQDSIRLLTHQYEQALADTHLNKTQYVDLHTYLPGDLLVKVDRMTMACSLEARSPFLDHNVLELAASMPDHLKIRGLTQKWILRKAFADKLPSENVKRIKRGFSVPISEWFRASLHGMAQDLLLRPQTHIHDYVRPDAIEKLLSEHRTLRRDHGSRIWALLMLELWHVNQAL